MSSVSGMPFCIVSSLNEPVIVPSMLAPLSPQIHRISVLSSSPSSVDRVDHPTDVVVGVLGVARRRPPSGARRTRFSFSGTSSHAGNASLRGVSSASAGMTPSSFWRGERLLAELVPSLVELPLVLVGPLLRDVVWCVAAAGREVHEERLVGVLRAHAVQPRDRAVGHRIREVVRMFLVVVPRVGPDDLLVLRQDRIPLTRAAAEDPVEVVEAPAVRPPVERPGRTLLRVRCQVPLPERGRAVAVVPQDPRQRRAAPAAGSRSSPGTRPRTRRSIRTRPRGCSARSTVPRASASTAR